MKFEWLPILKWLQGKKIPWDGVFGFIDDEKSIWLEVYDGKIHAFPNDFQTRFTISNDEAKTIYQISMIQPTLFEM